eukprot:COSAG01_NODE_11369_length_1951_cov_1.386069_3_plen_76_part_00
MCGRYKRAVQMLSRGLRLEALGEVCRTLEELCERAAHAAGSGDDAAADVAGSGSRAALVWLYHLRVIVITVSALE